jgi:hypothetical protein
MDDKYNLQLVSQEKVRKKNLVARVTPSRVLIWESRAIGLSADAQD